MPKDLDQRRAADERLSALADGELEAGFLPIAQADWREDAQSRATWHAYQLIGDVLRSDDLASNAPRDAAFLAALRVRLAAEPVVLAPEGRDASVKSGEVWAAAGAGARRSRWSWRSSSAVAAGFVVVAGALVVMSRSNQPPTAPQELAVAAPSGAAVQTRNVSAAAQPAAAVEPPSLIANGKLIRDARLDRYLAAHKQFAGTSALGVPSAYLRSATAEAGDR